MHNIMLTVYDDEDDFFFCRAINMNYYAMEQAYFFVVKCKRLK